MSAVATMILYDIGIMFVTTFVYFVVKEAIKDALIEFNREKNNSSEGNNHAEN